MTTITKRPPGPKGLPFLGSIRQMLQDRIGFLTANRDQFGDIVYFQLGSRHIYQLNNPEYVQYVLVKHPEQFQKTPALKRAAQDSIGQGLLTSDGELHKRQRRLVQPAFHHKRIAAYADTMVNYTDDMLHECRDSQQISLLNEMMHLTMRIVAKTLFDTDVTDKADSIGAAISIGIEATADRVSRPMQLMEKLPTATNRKRRNALKVIDETINHFIDERKASDEDKGDLLSMLLMAVDEQDGGQMTNKQVKDEAMTLFVAGHETTANALAWTFYLLGKHPEIERKLAEEITTTIQGRLPALADLPKLPYLEMVIKESMRMYPPAWTTSREAQEDIELGGYTIPKGSTLMMSMYVIHHDARYWEQPDEFHPERFAAANEEHIPKYAYFPFGGGPRVCVGNQFAMMEAQLILATILQRYQLSLVPGQDIKPNPLVTLRPQPDIQMSLTKRESLKQAETALTLSA
ncbi:MAG: cytochrome P450 [Anaerolineaceae bacterium]|nr:cytochrome P450 [Anaerolineaceae bacterium]